MSEEPKATTEERSETELIPCAGKLCSNCNSLLAAEGKFCNRCGSDAHYPASTNEQVTETRDTKPCPFCAETIKTAAIICKHCHSNLSGSAEHSVSLAHTQPSVSVKTDGSVPQQRAPLESVNLAAHLAAPSNQMHLWSEKLQTRIVAYLESLTPSRKKLLLISAAMIGASALIALSGVIIAAMNGAGDNNVKQQDEKTSDESTPPSAAPDSHNPDEVVDKIILCTVKGNQDAANQARSELMGLPKPTAGDNKNAVDLNKVGLSNLKAKKYAEAVADFQSACAADPSDARWRSNLGYAGNALRRFGISQDGPLQIACARPLPSGGMG